MNRDQLRNGFFFQVTPDGKIPLLSDFVKAVERWAFSNPKRKGFLGGPKRVFEKRSNQQNRTVMGLWLDTILEDKGYEQEDKNYIFYCLKMDMGWTVDRVDKNTGLVRKAPRPTKDLDMDGYSKFMELFARHVATHEGISLPDPKAELARL